MRGQRIRRWRVDTAVSALHHERERHRVLALAEGIAVQLELAAVGGERHAEGHRVTLRAGHPGLTRETRHRGGDPREGRNHENQQRESAASIAVKVHGALLLLFYLPRYKYRIPGG